MTGAEISQTVQDTEVSVVSGITNAESTNTDNGFAIIFSNMSNLSKVRVLYQHRKRIINQDN